MNRLTPFAMLSIAALVTAALTAAALLLAMRQPWLGTDVQLGTDGRAVIAAVEPGADLPEGLEGARLVAVGRTEIEPADLVEEPDMLDSFDQYRRLLARQGALVEALAAPVVPITVADKRGTRTLNARPASSRPFFSLPAVFWVQIATGAASFMIGIWVWSLRRRDFSAGLLAAAGFAMLLMIYPAAIYGTRELALEPGLFRWLAAIDHFGALALGVALLSLFFVYPHPLMPRRALFFLPATMALWWLADTFWLLPGSPLGFHLPVLLMTLIFFATALMQLRRARRDPAALAALRWLALTVLIGAGSFVMVMIAPHVFGFRPAFSQGYAFAMFLVIFVGVAIGVARHRLFELEDYAFDFLFYFGAVALLLLLDALFISLVALERVPAFSVSLLAIALAYLPARDLLARRLSRRREIDRGALFHLVTEAALSRNLADKRDRWREIMAEIFRPLAIADEPEAAGGMAILDEGVAMRVAAPDGPPLRLSHGYSGRRLFSPRDLRLARELSQLFTHMVEMSEAREQGVAEERARITREMHDNIGAQLLSALRSHAVSRKDAIIRDTLGDLRMLINNQSGLTRSLDDALAELRVEIAERLEDVGIAFAWHLDGGGASLVPAAVHEVRSILREAVTNTIRHSGASRMTISIRREGPLLCLDISDDGAGRGASCPAEGAPGGGNGLANMRARLEAMGGTLILGEAGGFRLIITIPLTYGART